MGTILEKDSLHSQLKDECDKIYAFDLELETQGKIVSRMHTDFKADLSNFFHFIIFLLRARIYCIVIHDSIFFCALKEPKPIIE
jgi:hypothetical protein